MDLQFSPRVRQDPRRPFVNSGQVLLGLIMNLNKVNYSAIDDLHFVPIMWKDFLSLVSYGKVYLLKFLWQNYCLYESSFGPCFIFWMVTQY